MGSLNANKIAGGGGGGAGAAVLLVYLLSRFKINLSADDGALIVTAAVAAGAFIAHNGILGVARIFLRGNSQPPVMTTVVTSYPPLTSVPPEQPKA